jgi:hypothetical protein
LLKAEDTFSLGRKFCRVHHIVPDPRRFWSPLTDSDLIPRYPVNAQKL